jgi:cytoskeletal protein CcmA (bactofilin family)
LKAVASIQKTSKEVPPSADSDASFDLAAVMRGPFSVISRDICIEGELQGRENLVIEGRLKGRLQTEGDVAVAAGAHVEAVIMARNITIRGRVNGNIEAEEAVAIQPQGILIGDCRARSIQIHEGARFEGRSEILK